MKKIKNILLIITGGIAAYKSLELIRKLKDQSINVTCILTRSGSEFVTPLSVASLSGNHVILNYLILPTKIRWDISSYRERLI